jgi:hypothetical protein
MPSLIPASVTVVQEATLAWARDKITSELIHIDQCSGAGGTRPLYCAGCDHPLTVKPASGTNGHDTAQFLHPDGYTPLACLLRTAQAIIEDMLHPGQKLVLPARTYPVTVTGLSGAQYTVVVPDQPEQVQILSSSPLDVLRVLLVLDNDQEIELRIIGSWQGASSYQGGDRYVLQWVVDEPSLASLSPSALQLRLPELLAGARWTSHWRDKELADRGRQAALGEAAIWLDWDGGNSPLDATLRHKVLLHRTAAAILEDARLLKIPGWSAFESGTGGQDASQDAGQPAKMVSLARVSLEDRLGGLVPDIVVQMENGAEIIVGITVPNGEHPVRATAHEIPLLELDFAPLAGFCTKAQFREVVVHALTGKRWIRSPGLAGLQPISVMTDQPASSERTPEERAMFRIRPDEWARRYLNAVSDYALLDEAAGSPKGKRSREEIAHCAAGLAVHGYSGANDPALYSKPESLLQRLIRIRDAAGRGMGVSWPVLEAIINDAAISDCAWHSVYLMAAKAYNPPLTEDQTKRVRIWRERVRRSIENEERYYQRDPIQDDLLGLLFPELKKGLSHPFGRRPPLASTDIDQDKQDDLQGDALHRSSAKRSKVLPDEYCTVKREQELAWVHPLATRVEIAKTIRGRMSLKGEGGAARTIVEEVIALTDETEPWRFATTIKNQAATSKRDIYKFLYGWGLLTISGKM